MTYKYLSLVTGAILLAATLLSITTNAATVNGQKSTIALNSIHTTQPLIIDGNLDEATWKSAPAYDKFFILNSNKTPTQSTSIRILFDDKAIYLGIKCNAPRISTQKITALLRDGHVWNDESIEIFIFNSDMHKSFYHLLFNSAGVRTDFRHMGNKGSVKWDAPWQVRVQQQSSSWTAEVVLPFYIFPLHNPKSVKWSINIGRNHNTTISHLLAKNTFLALADFPTIDGITANLTPYAIYCDKLKSASIPGATSAKVIVTQTIINDSDMSQKVKLEGWLCDRANNISVADRFIEIPPTDSKKIKLNFTVSQSGNYQYVANIIDAQGQVRSVTSFPLNIDLTPLAVKLQTPNYHNAIFSSQTIKKLVSQITIGLDKKELPEKVLKQQLFMNGKIISECTVNVQKRSMIVNFPLPNSLPNGNYTLLTTLLDKNNKEIAKSSNVIRKLPAVSSETRITSTNKVISNNKPILPLGIFGYVEDPELYKKFDKDFPAINVIHNYYHSLYSIPLFKRLLDRFGASGKKLILYPYGEHPNKYQQVTHLPSTAIGKMAQVINAVKNHPALLGYQIVDEPEIHGPSLAVTKEICDAVVKLDPYHPLIILNDTISGVRKWANTGDILTPDPYILPIKGAMYEYKRIQGVAYPYDFVHEASKSGKPVWAVLQAFNYASFALRHVDTRFPNYHELRASSYISLIGGATGLLYFSYSALWDTPHNTIGLRDLLNEIKALKSVILSSDGPKIELKDKTKGIYIRTKQLGDDIYIFAANALPKSSQISFTLPNRKTLYVLGEQREIKYKNGLFIDRMAPLQVHVYTTAAQHIKIKPIAKTDHEIAEDIKRIDNENLHNLAYFKHGAKIESSIYFRQVYLNNGIKACNWQDSTKQFYVPNMGKMKMDKITGMFIKVILPAKKRIESVELYGKPLYGKIGLVKNYTISILQPNGWYEIVKRQGNKSVNIIARFTPVEAKEILIRFAQQGTVTINEIRIIEAQ